MIWEARSQIENSEMNSTKSVEFNDKWGLVILKKSLQTAEFAVDKGIAFLEIGFFEILIPKKTLTSVY